MKHPNTEDFYSSIRLVIETVKPKKILFLSKAVCEQWLLPDMLTYANDIHVDYISLQEAEILHIECKIMESTTYPFPNHYVSFDELKKFSFLESYDFIIMDTVHYKEYMDYIFKNIIPLCNGFVLLHDTLPQSEGALTVARRTDDRAWTGQTYISFHNFCLANKGIAKNFEDSYVGYGLIDCRNGVNIDYDDSKLWDLGQIKPSSIPHIHFNELFLSC